MKSIVSRNCTEASLRIIRRFLKKRMVGIFVSLDALCSVLYEEFTKHKTDLSRLYIINAACKGCSIDMNCTHISYDLTDLFFALSVALETERFDFVVISDVSALFSRFSHEAVEGFFAALIKKIRQHGRRVILKVCQGK